MVWGCCVGGLFLGPIFVEKKMNSDVYIEMLRDGALLLLQSVQEDFDEFFFQQDGARCHTSKKTIEFLRESLWNVIISQNGDVNWPPKSPDLSVLDFYMWGSIKI